MTVLEMPSQVVPVSRWTEVCSDHAVAGARGVRSKPTVSSARPARPVRPARATRSAGGAAGGVRTVRRPGEVAVAPGRRVRGGAASAVRSCRVQAPAPAPVRVVDDVPTWALLACGVVVGVLLVLAVAFIGGPTYA